MARGIRRDDVDPASLAGRLRAFREAVGLSQPQVVAAVKRRLPDPRSGISQANMSRIETGQARPTPAQVRALFAEYEDAAPEVYEARRAEAEQIMAEVDTAAEEFTDARVVLQAGGAHHFQRRIHDAETGSQLVRAYQPATILGILQAREYIEAVFTPDDDLSPADAAASVQARLARQAGLRDESRRWHLLQTEWALRSPVFSYELQAAQLDHLAAVASWPNVQLGVIPLDTVIQDPGPMTGFHLFDDRLVQVGTDTGTALVSDPKRVAPYIAWFGRLEERAVYGDDARALLERIAKDYRRGRVESAPVVARPSFDPADLAAGLRALADEIEAGGRPAPRRGHGPRRVGGAPVVPIVVHDALCGIRVATRQEGADQDVMVCAGCGMAFTVLDAELARDPG